LTVASENVRSTEETYVASLTEWWASDAFTLAIAHTEGKTQVLDVIRERKRHFA
jgi:hypothetical protein